MADSRTKAEIEAENVELKAQLTALNEGISPDEGEDNRNIAQRLAAIAKEVGVIELERKGGVPFAYRGIDDVVGKLSPLLNKHGVFVTPIDVEQTLSQAPASGKTLTKADLVVKYRFYGVDGTFIDAMVPGQADDFADRSTAQAMSVAFRILLLQTFHIPAFGNEEAASQATLTEREKAGAAKVEAARGATAPAAPSANDADRAQEMRKAILAAAGSKGWDGEKTTAFVNDFLGVDVDEWWDNPELLNKVLVKIHDAK